MNKLFKTILISFVVLSAGFLVILPANATQVDELVVEYWSETANNWLLLSGPIFSETNFLPGQGVTRLIRVTNNSGETQRIATEAINKSDPDNFASQLNLTIKEGATTIFSDTLAKFFSQGETSLSDLGSVATTTYDYTITFNAGSGNNYQEKSLGFDILVGFEGTEGGLPLPQPGGTSGNIIGGGGGGGPIGLTIQYEKDVYVGTTTAIITWLTTYNSTSRVIYDTVQGTFNLNILPNYGYTFSTPETDAPANTNGVTFHQVTLTGLTPGTTYYYRCVSHGSLAVSTEHGFTTLTVAQEEAGTIKPGEEIGGVTVSGAGGTEQGRGGLAITPGGIATEGVSTGTGMVGGVTEGTTTGTTTTGFNVQNLLAAIGSLFSGQNLWWLLLLFIIIVLVLFFLSRRKKSESLDKK